MTELPHREWPSVILFHDSFGEALEPFFTHHASRCTSVWRGFDPALVEDQKPDLVVEVFVEYSLYRPPIANVPEQGQAAQHLFDDSGVTVFTLDAARDAATIGRNGGIDVELEGTALRLHWTTPLAKAQLPDAILQGATHVVLRLDIAPESPCDLNFFYRTRETDPYTRRNSLSRTLTAGDNRLYLDLDVPGIRGSIAFHSTTVSVLTLRGCEARAVR